jgi:hypothetical protein
MKTSTALLIFGLAILAVILYVAYQAYQQLQTAEQTAQNFLAALTAAPANIASAGVQAVQSLFNSTVTAPTMDSVIVATAAAIGAATGIPGASTAATIEAQAAYNALTGNGN